MQNNLQKVGYIRKPHGYKGHLQIRLEKSLKENWFKEPIFVEMNEQSVPFFIEDFAEKPNGNIIIKLFDCNSEAEALKFKNRSIWINSDYIIETFDYTFLIGWKVKDLTAQKEGIITDIIEYPHQILIYATISQQEILIPFVDDFIVEINRSEQLIIFRLPDGLLDINL
jgi:16S rRNA processing protein RimM